VARRIESLSLAGPAGSLEALLEEPDDQEPRVAAVVCHPHPLYGGTMHNKVVYRIARGLRRAGCVVLRFNFRGVGRSEGAHGYMAGEIEDARAALGYLRARYPDLPFALAGFSFGSRAIMQLGCELGAEQVQSSFEDLAAQSHLAGESACPTKTQALAQQRGTDAFVCQPGDLGNFASDRLSTRPETGAAIGQPSATIGHKPSAPQFLLAAGFATRMGPVEFLANCAVPKIFIHSTHDEFGPRPDFEPMYLKVAEPKRLIWIEAADHFFAGALPELEERVMEAASAPPIAVV
jgi:alpha/beta superfamily hydrolase